MGIENQYEYYRILASEVPDLVKQYNEEKEVWSKKLVKVANSFGADPSACISDWSTHGLKCVNLCFKQDHKFDFKYEITQQKRGLITIRVDGRDKKSGEFAAKLDAELRSFNKEWKSKLSLGDWIINYFDCRRLVVRAISGEENSFLLETNSVYGASKNLIMLRIPIVASAFTPPKCFVKITYDQFYDLNNGVKDDNNQD